MKNLFGKILVGVAGCAMALSINAFAADIAITNVAADKETGAVTVSGTITGSAESQEATIIVVEQGVSLATVTDAQIKYIDQETAQSGAFSYDFKLATGKSYDVYCGGTDVTAPVDGQIDLTAAVESDKFKIVGTISVVSLKDVTAVAGDVTGTVGTDGAYVIEVAPGTYNVVVGKPGYLYKTYADVVITDADKDLGTATLIPGSLTGDEAVNLSDLTLLLSNYNKAEFDDIFDLNDDGAVNLSDLTLLLSGYNKSYE